MSERSDQVRLVGRDEQLAAVEDMLAQPTQNVALALSGPPGLGKSCLLEEIGRRADEKGWLVLEGRADEFQQAEPFAPYVAALDDYLASLDWEPEEDLGEAVTGELAGVFPAIERSVRATPKHPVESERYRSHRAVRTLLAHLVVRRPLLLALDDVHWADDASLDLTSYLLRRPPRHGVVVALAYRAGQLPERLAQALGAAEQAGDLQRIELRPLTREEVSELVGQSIRAELHDELYEQSGGNPFYLEELRRDLLTREEREPARAERSIEGVPASVSQAIVRELAALRAEAQPIARAAAMLTEPFEPDLVAATAGVEETAALSEIDELLALELVRATDVPRRFRFRHPIVRRAIYESAPQGWRLGAHKRAAEALAARGVPPLLRAHHVECSAELGDGEAIELLSEAARAAAGRAPSEAAHWYGAALRLVSPSETAKRLGILVPMAMAQAAAGQFEAARESLQEVLGALPADQTALRGRVVAACARLEHVLGHHGAARELLEVCLRELPDESSSEAMALKLELGADAFFAGDFARMRTWVRQGFEDALKLGDRSSEAAAASLLGSTEYMNDEISAAREWFDRAAPLVAEAGDEGLAPHLYSHTWSALAQIFLERFDEAHDLLERGIRVATQTGQGQVPALMRITQAFGLLWRGRLGPADELLEAAIESSLLSGNVQALAWGLSVRCWRAILAGELQTAVRLGGDAVATIGEDPDPVSVLAACYLAEARFEAGHSPRGCRDELLAAVGGPDLPPIERGFKPRWYEFLTRVELAAGDGRAAQVWAERGWHAAVGMDIAGRTAEALRARSELALSEGDAEGAARHAHEAVKLNAQAGLGIEAGRSQILLGRALATNDRDGAVRELEEAREVLDLLGARRYSDQAARELRALGRRVARRGKRGSADGGIDGLSGREREIAELVAAGKTNREIAAELFLSEKTIESHMSRIFGKLGVARRTQLARLVERADKG